MRRLMIAFALCALLGAVAQLRGQSNSSQTPSFEVASIKPDEDPSHRGNNFDVTTRDLYYTGSGLSARYLIKYAYGLKSDEQLSGGPAWIDTDKFVINAKSPDSYLPQGTDWRAQDAAIRLEMRSLLADRFQLKISHQTKDLSGFALVVAKGGPKFKQGDASSNNSSVDGHNVGSVQILTIENEPMQSLIDDLARQPEIGGHLVFDQTSLAGVFSLGLKWTRQSGTATATMPADAAADAPSLWTALQEQLGLRLESKKAPVDTLVIDHVEGPTPN